MAIKMISVKCPECGASMAIEDDRKTAFCNYCGAQIILYNENEYTININNEAELKRAETDRYKAETDRINAETDQKINMMKMKLARRSKLGNRIITVVSFIVAALLGLVSIIGFLRGGIEMGVMPALFAVMAAIMPAVINEYMGDIDSLSTKIKVPASISGYERKNYQAVKTMFESAGFSNIRCTPLHDLTKETSHKLDRVYTITINGELLNGGYRRYPKDAVVFITYHSLR